MILTALMASRFIEIYFAKSVVAWLQNVKCHLSTFQMIITDYLSENSHFCQMHLLL